MAINIKIDNDQTTGPIDQLVLDESAGVQELDNSRYRK